MNCSALPRDTEESLYLHISPIRLRGCILDTASQTTSVVPTFFFLLFLIIIIIKIINCLSLGILCTCVCYFTTILSMNTSGFPVN